MAAEALCMIRSLVVNAHGNQLANDFTPVGLQGVQRLQDSRAS